MFQKKTLRFGTMGVIGLFFLYRQAICEDIGTAPFALQAAIILKVLAFNNTISSGGAITVYVSGSPDFAAEMKKAAGKAVGAATIGKIVEGAGLPSEKPSVIYVGTESSLAEILAYTKSNKILSISGNPALVSKNVSLVIGVSESKPKILLNLSSSKDEGIDWNPAILKVAVTTK
jgi:hypothetical protein